MEERATKLTPAKEEPAVAPERESGGNETPSAPRPTFTREYPVFGYE